MKSFMTLLLCLTLATLLPGQKKKNAQPTERAVTGVISGADGSPIPGAIVQLKNTKTLAVRSYIADSKGLYSFHGLSTDIDYELKAESNGKFSGTKTLSSFDTHPEATINLQIK